MSTASEFVAELRKRLNADHNKRGTEIINGVPTEQYRERVAYLRAIRDVLDLIPAIEEHLRHEGKL